jgi:hypothetical protein
MPQQAVELTPKERRNKVYGALEAFPEFMRRFDPPTGAFDPHGPWKHSYAIQLFADPIATAGFLEIERRPSAGETALTISTGAALGNGHQDATFRLISADDKMGSLRSIEIESVSRGLDGALLLSTEVSLTGQVRGGSIEWTRAGRKRTAPAPAPLLSNWSLFDTVQRLKPDSEQPIEFTLLDDGDLLKPNQRLVYLGKHTVVVAGGASLMLDGWEQTGYGVLPVHYWVASDGRLLFAIAGQKAFLYDPGARDKDRAKGRKNS